jgi:hypothetical protein
MIIEACLFIIYGLFQILAVITFLASCLGLPGFLFNLGGSNEGSNFFNSSSDI